MRSTSYYRPVHQAFLIVVLTVAVLIGLSALYTIREILIGALIGIGLGVLIAPPSQYLKRKYRIPKALTSIAFLLLFFGVLFAAVYFIISMVSDQIIPIFAKLPRVLNEIQDRFSHLSAIHPWLKSSGLGLNLEKYASGAAGAAVEGLKFGASAIGGVVFIFFLALYLSIRPKDYLDGFLSAFPAHMRPRTHDVLVHSAQALRNWFWAQLTAMVIVGSIASIALLIVGSRYWIFFGAITAVLELIPYFGPLIAFFTVCLVTLAATPDSLLKTAIAFLVVLNLEGNVVIPLVMKGKVDLKPIHVLILIAVMGDWFGVFGFLLATPVLAVLRTIYLRAYLPKMDAQDVAPGEIPARSVA